MDGGALTFPVCTFKRVYDTHPLPEVLALPELVACFRRFELKPQLHARIERELGRIERALEKAIAGEPVAGSHLAAIALAGTTAKGRGENAELAMHGKADELRAAARRDAKTDLRLWSPVRYAEGANERGSAGVTHVSCLVLDYDSGVHVDSAASVFADWFHLVHTTWSHTERHPKFRLILPLAVPVPASEWEKLWLWAERQSGGEIDPAMKGPAATYALPAVANVNAPRDARSSAGPLLDPRDVGIDVGEPLRLPVLHVPISPMRGDPEKEYVEHRAGEAIYVYDEGWDDPTYEPEHADTNANTNANASANTNANANVSARRPRRRHRETVCVDFDGVLHSYVSGWQGGTVIPDPPVRGAIAWLARVLEDYEVAVYSTRTREAGAPDAMRAWLRSHGLADELVRRLAFPRSKPPARIYVDDRAWRFEGTFPTVEQIDAFEPWRTK